MKNRIIKFSGGNSSFAVAAWVKENYPDDNIVLYFNDVMWEDADLYRFNLDVSKQLQLPLLVQGRGINPPQLMVLKAFLANNRAGFCSQELKIKVAQRFLKKGIVPELEYWVNGKYLKQSIHVERNDEFFANTTLYFGIGWEEMHREKSIYENWQPFDVQFPLIMEIDDRKQYFDRYNVTEGRLYKEGFAHNNCGGRCVKAGQGHFHNLSIKREQDFIKLMEQEIIIGWYARYVRQPTFKKIYKRYTFDELLAHVRNPEDFPLEVDPMFKDVYQFATDGTKTAKLQHIIDTHRFTKNNIFGQLKQSKKDIKEPLSFMKNLTLEEYWRSMKAQLSIFDFDMQDIGGCGCSVDYGTCTID
ncbi:hypothetical protein [Lysinibacillus pakistanensis]|uniref:Phosphoadenosine phosphosulfate reductase family protein n=1 Tax=Lysinibacillus pakistanensis TaxID=759811 RepID=A0AAX3WVW9_9BACI|nr:hypothetical protein [Lysinibacillus pakistanensis]MDM5231469.1 hypothetical protein [Lysinibacillus pakistanensis]WHY47016.1 hypothetical protein QNH22_02010 [Lysinibacillus pakistanensis]WHY52028.1 hypothetical protein QNH24_02005 [Lysinibacillus pakistanensis]